MEGEQADSVRVLFAKSKAKMLQLNYQEAAADLHRIFTEIDQTETDAYIQYGHCKFLLGEYEEAKIAFYQAIRIFNLKGEKLQDSLVHQRIGAILISQKKWEDAKVMFEMCADNYETAFSYMNLGIACLYLKQYNDAESVLQRANILDTTNSNVWGYMTLAMIKNGKRLNNAFQSLKEAMRLGIDNSELILDIASSFAAEGKHETATKSLEYALTTRASTQN